ncbi:MAG: stage II sporulation protein M [Candidatus Bathyarchaeia archaeon]
MGVASGFAISTLSLQVQVSYTAFFQVRIAPGYAVYAVFGPVGLIAFTALNNFLLVLAAYYVPILYGIYQIKYYKKHLNKFQGMKYLRLGVFFPAFKSLNPLERDLYLGLTLYSLVLSFSIGVLSIGFFLGSIMALGRFNVFIWYLTYSIPHGLPEFFTIILACSSGLGLRDFLILNYPKNDLKTMEERLRKRVRSRYAIFYLTISLAFLFFGALLECYVSVTFANLMTHNILKLLKSLQSKG